MVVIYPCLVPFMDLASPDTLVLAEINRRFKKSELAKKLHVDPRVISRWEKGGLSVTDKMALLYLLHNSSPSVRIKAAAKDFTFIDLFAGIGGTRLGFESAGGDCIFTSEWDPAAQKTYCANFPMENHTLIGDIHEVTDGESWGLLPKHDLLLAGFPCQPFSIAGVSKKNSMGISHGFACDAQGTLFFDIAKIIKKRRPAAFLLENVKNLRSHDNGNTFKVIQNVLENELRYKVFYKVIDARGFVPQHRERIYIVGFKDDVPFDWNDFNFPDPSSKKLSSILHPQNGTEEAEEPYTTGKNGRVAAKYTLSDKLWDYLQGYAAKHQAQGNGFGFGLVGKNDTSRTLSARYYKDGSEILIKQGANKNPRRLTPRECARLMGFDSDDRQFNIVVADTPAYKQFGNSVVVPVVSEIARIMKPHIMAIKG
jgi:DNA (cytosine-5)-methyltransferase 1